jgi:hypothetical protein
MDKYISRNLAPKERVNSIESGRIMGKHVI